MTLKQYLVAGIGAFILAAGAVLGMQTFGTTTFGATTLFVSQGGTGTTTIPTNYVLLGFNSSRITAVSTSSLGISATPASPANSLQYNNAGAFGGSAKLVFNGSDTITFGTEGVGSNFLGKDATTNNTAGSSFFISGGAGLGSGSGGSAVLRAGSSGTTGDGGGASLIAADGGSGGGVGADVTVTAGAAQAGNNSGGRVLLNPGGKSGSGTKGHVFIGDPSSGRSASLVTDSLSADRNYTFPDAAGVFCLAGVNCASTTTANTWTGLQSFSNASTSLLTVTGNTWLTNLAVAAGTFLAVDNNGKVIATTSPSAALTGTTGQLPYFSGTNTAVGTSTLFLTNAGLLGIGTTSPAYLLDVFGNINVNGTVGAYKMDGTTILNASSTTNNVLVGRAGAGLTTGVEDTALGYLALGSATTPNDNTALGWSSMLSLITGNANTVVGSAAMELGASGANNVIMGYQGMLSGSGSNNTILGSQAGTSLTTGSSNILIGRSVNVASTTGSSQLNIGSLIFGDAFRNTGGTIGMGSSTPLANLQVTDTGANATSTLEIGKASQNKGSCLKLYRTDGSAIYAYVAAGATAFTLTTTACASITGF